MPEVVCNTSPVQYLHLLGKLEVLPQLYGRVLLPPAVVGELEAGRALGVALPDVRSLPWLEIRPLPVNILYLPGDLDRGEWEVLNLAHQLSALAIVDDGRARAHAQRHGLRFTGTVGVLLRAKASGLLGEIKPLLEKLRQLGFRLDNDALATALRLAGESQP
jgi:uncharacterized protein